MLAVEPEWGRTMPSPSGAHREMYTAAEVLPQRSCQPAPHGWDSLYCLSKKRNSNLTNTSHAATGGRYSPVTLGGMEEGRSRTEGHRYALLQLPHSILLSPTSDLETWGVSILLLGVHKS